MTHEVGIREFRERLGDWLARIEAGDVVVLTRHGQRVARVTRASVSEPVVRALMDPRIEGLQPGGLQLPEPVPRTGDKMLSDYVSEGRR